MKAQELIDQLVDMTKQHKAQVEDLKPMSLMTLNDRPELDGWTVLECIEHLNRYGDFYIPEIEQRMAKSTRPAHADFRSGRLGDYFAKSMLPRAKLNKMKTFKAMNPFGSDLDKRVLDTFIRQQEDLLRLLEAARHQDLTKTKTAISISKLIKLRLGDTFRVVIYHNLRHMKQVERVLAQM